MAVFYRLAHPRIAYKIGQAFKKLALKRAYASQKEPRRQNQLPTIFIEESGRPQKLRESARPLVKLKRKIWNTFYKGSVNQISYFGYFRGNNEASPSQT